MTPRQVTPTNVEIIFGEDEIIVSKTDPKGKLTYVNEVFLRLAGYPEEILVGAPHSIIRHPAMPRGVFKLLWDTIQGGQEIFAYVKNMSANGDHYWVLAHVTPSFGADRSIVGYHSNRRVARREALAVIEPLYGRMLAEESRYSSRPEAAAASVRMLTDELQAKGLTYDEFIWSLEGAEVGA